MAYRIVKNAAVWWPVRWNDVEESGAIVEREIEVKFKRFGKAELTAIDFGALSNTDFLEKVAVDWRGVEGEDGKPLAFTRTNIDQFFDQPALLGEAVASAWAACLRAEPERRLGFSAPSPDAGPATATDLSPGGLGSATS